MSLALEIGLAYIGVFAFGMFLYAWVSRGQPFFLSPSKAFLRLRYAILQCMEGGKLLHFALGAGGMLEKACATYLSGFNVLQETTRLISTSDKLPVATSADGLTAIFSQNSFESAYRAIQVETSGFPRQGYLVGASSFSYVAGVLPLIFDPSTQSNVIFGRFGGEVGLLIDAAERRESLTISASDQFSAQAVLYAIDELTLIGETVFIGDGYLKNPDTLQPAYIASVFSQDLLRWIIVFTLIILMIARLIGLF